MQAHKEFQQSYIPRTNTNGVNRDNGFCEGGEIHETVHEKMLHEVWKETVTKICILARGQCSWNKGLLIYKPSQNLFKTFLNVLDPSWMLPDAQVR